MTETFTVSCCSVVKSMEKIMAQRCGVSNFVELIHHQQQDISDIFTYCSVVLCAQRVDCRTGFGMHHGGRAWFGVACARRYLTMAGCIANDVAFGNKELPHDASVLAVEMNRRISFVYLTYLCKVGRLIFQCMESDAAAQAARLQYCLCQLLVFHQKRVAQTSPS